MVSREKDRLSAAWLNGLVLERPEALVALSERIYNNQIRKAADAIAQKRGVCSILLLSGPSGSTKTTTAAKLSEKLSRRGVHSVVISLDNFFLNQKQVPLLPNGKPDYESLNTMDLTKLSECIEELFVRHESEFPIFDFVSQSRSEQTQHIRVNEESIVIMEGIHALNPIISQGHDPSGFLKLFISPNSDYFVDDQKILTARDIRLVRRIVRDYFHRGTSVDKTMDMWVGVVKGEIANILPYKTEADLIIDSTILYEPNIYETYLGRILAKSEIRDIYQPKIHKLTSALAHFLPLDEKYIPAETVLHEFLE